MDSVLSVVDEYIRAQSLLQWGVWIALLYPLYRAVAIYNCPTLNDHIPKRIAHKNRLQTALFYVPFTVSAMVVNPIALLIFLTVLSFKGIGEFISLSSPHHTVVNSAFEQCDPNEKKNSEGLQLLHHSFTIPERVVQCGGPIMLWSAYIWDFRGQSISFGLVLIVTMCVHLIALVIDGLYQQSEGKVATLPEDALSALTIHTFALLWIGYTLSFLGVLYKGDVMGYPRIAYGTQGEILIYPGVIVAITTLTAWLGDATAYYVGSRYGKVRIMPSVSPKKSLEGAVSEVILGIVFLQLFHLLQIYTLHPYIPNLSTWEYLVWSLWTCVGGIIGDALESLVKRVGKVKDSGLFFPGHGGILDRFDTFFINMPFVIYYFLLQYNMF